MTASRLLVLCILPIAAAGCGSGSSVAKKVGHGIGGRSPAGEYVAWLYHSPKLPPMMDTGLAMRHKLVLRPDGTFEEHIEERFMLDATIETTGTYTHAGEEVDFIGSSVLRRRSEKPSAPIAITYKMKFDGQRLLLDQKHNAYIMFLPPGIDPPRTIDPADSPKPEALKMLKDLEERYANIKLYSDTGTTLRTSTKPGTEPKSFEFQTKFDRGRTYRFDATLKRAGKTYANHAIWMKGSEAWIETSDSGIGPRKCSISDAMGNSEATTIVALLLFPGRYRGRLLGGSSEVIELMPDERIDGRECNVLSLREGHSGETTLWIDKETGLAARYVRTSFGRTEDTRFHAKAG